MVNLLYRSVTPASRMTRASQACITPSAGDIAKWPTSWFALEPMSVHQTAMAGKCLHIFPPEFSSLFLMMSAHLNIAAICPVRRTPLHCAASCNDRDMCEFLVRNGAAVMAFTHRDGATASQKCDPYLDGFIECESYLRAKEESMGVDNNGVLYALWSYQAQAPDELNFKEGDMVTILQITEGSDWWWASLCGTEGFVPNNFFGVS
ncbi:hypothetical protein XENOCAPTIV_002852 [Xenoophorus captivus]|uniref:SH3 domain-containing protein n=1 Tax=Xenoophorus captivus TaxID=1517983 RepID=A0ABV0QQI6_9TELE